MVAVQIRGVPDEVRRSLADEAEARGQSLQAFLLDVLEREAANSANRSFVRNHVGPLADGRRVSVDVEGVLRADRERDDR